MKQFKVLSLTKHLPVSILSLLFLFQPQEVRSQFANGADIGWLSQMEAQGYVFNNDSGVQENCLVILKEHGINALRFRVWVNPTGKYCGKKDVAYMSHRADSLGFRVMLDFHFSDTWADPSHQTKPAAWVGHTVAQLDSDVYHHVYEILDALKTIGVTPAWVQIGNETNDGMLWEDGRASTHMNNFAAMVLSGYNAVKAVDTTIQVIVHLSDGHNNSMYRRIFDGLKSNGAKWDIIGMSVYPYWTNPPLPWNTDDSLALINMKDMIARYQTKVMVTETGYLYYQAATANSFLVDLLRKTKSIGGLGVFYWEPECYNWQGYNLGAWDPFTKKATVAMDAFLDTVITSVNREEIISHCTLNAYPNPFNPTTIIEFTLAEDSHVLLKVYDVLGRELAILINQELKAGKSHSSVFNASRLTSGIYFCRMEAGKSSLVKKLLLMK